MRSFTHTAHIDRTPEELFAFMVDFRNAPRWRSLVRSIEVVDGHALQRGSKLLVTMDVAGRERTAISELWSYDPPRRLGFRNTANNFTGEFEYVLQPERGGSVVTFTCDIRPHGIMWLLLPFVLRSNRARYLDQLDRLKRAVEGPASSDKMD